MALLLYLLSTAQELRRGRNDSVAAYSWLAGSLVFLSHVFFAFYYHHEMSHQAAFANTAARTEEALGFAFGFGIYFSYLFTVLWLGDAIWRVAAAESYAARAGWLHAGIHLYLFFIAINGAAVFESGVTRWGAGIGCLILLVLAWRRRRELGIQTPAVREAEST